MMPNTFALPGEAWRWAMKYVQVNGEKVITEDEQTTVEVRNLVLTISNPLSGWPIKGSGWDLPALDAYVRDQILGEANRTGFSYTYGQRLVPRLESLAKALRANPTSRRAVISLWQDGDYEIQHPPCWMALDFLVRGEALHLTAFIRSNDIAQAWPANAYGLAKLMEHVAGKVGVEVGSLTTHSVSAHIYEV